MPDLTYVPSIKFEVFFPTAYVDPQDPAKTTRFVQHSEVAHYLSRMTAKYQDFGGYTISNPLAPPPFSGVYQGGPPERGFVAILIVPDHLLNEAEQDVKQMVSFFQQKYYQDEILCYSSHVTRYVPLKA